MSDSMTPVQKRVKRFRFMCSELIALAIFLMLFVHLLWVAGALIVVAVRSRRRMSLRVSQPLCPSGSSLLSVQAGPNLSRV